MDEVTGVALIWADIFFDGPLAGLASYASRLCWFDAIPDEDVEARMEPREFILRELTPDEQVREEARHRLFEELVGTSFCVHLPSGERQAKPQETWDEFFRRHPYPAEPSYRSNPIIGWFSELTARPGR